MWSASGGLASPDELFYVLSTVMLIWCLFSYMSCSLSCDEFPVLGQTDWRFCLTFVWPSLPSCLNTVSVTLSESSIEAISVFMRVSGDLWPLRSQLVRAWTCSACWFGTGFICLNSFDLSCSSLTSKGRLKIWGIKWDGRFWWQTLSEVLINSSPSLQWGQELFVMLHASTKRPLLQISQKKFIKNVGIYIFIFNFTSIYMYVLYIYIIYYILL